MGTAEVVESFGCSVSGVTEGNLKITKRRDSHLFSPKQNLDLTFGRESPTDLPVKDDLYQIGNSFHHGAYH